MNNREASKRLSDMSKSVINEIILYYDEYESSESAFFLINLL